MGLPALEFSECYLDGPHFRERLRSHEEELDKTSKFIKELLKDGKTLIQALRGLSAAERKFADSLNHFRFQCIGDAETDHEMCIASSLQEFAAVLQNLEEERSRMIENASQVLILPLERFRKEQISAAKEAKKRYDKETEKYCGVLEKHLSLSSRRKEAQLQEADSQVEAVRQQFYQVSLDYVFKVQEVQERKMFDFVEPLLSFLQGLFTHYHHGYELAKDFSHFQTHLTISIQNTRNRFESTRSEVEGLMKKMKENPEEHKNIRQNVMEGYLFIQEKRSFVSSWVKYYCTYQREPRRVTMVTFDPRAAGKLGEQESFILRSCTRRKSDSIEKRFCFDVEAEDRPGVITIQAPSEEERRLWMEAMEGQEPVYNLNKDNQAEGTAQLDLVGFNVMKKFIYAVETRGLEEQGLYRLVGVTSKVQRLLNLAMDSKSCADVDLEGPDWEIKTITSAIKHYLRMLPAPLMTYQYQRSFIKAAKLEQQEDRVTEVHALVHRLPEKNRQMLELLMRHLATVAQHQQKNLMTVANLGVVFGPTLLRAQQETVAAIMDIKFQNIVVEILIQHQHRIFQDAPCATATDAAAAAPADPAGNSQQSRRRSCDSRAPSSASERPLTLFHTPTHSQRGEKRNSVATAAALELPPLDCPSSSSSSGAGGGSSNSNSSCTSSSSSAGGGGGGGRGRSSRLSLTSNDGEPEGRPTRPSSLLNPRSRCSAPTSAPSPPSPSSPSPSWPMFSAPSSPQPASSDSSPLSGAVPGGRRARALYACKAEHDSELSFIAGCIFQQVHASREPGWLEGSLDGRTGLIPENYVEFLS